jgi:hypothetical protein
MTNFHYNGCHYRGVPNYIGVWFMGVVMVPEAILEKLEPMHVAHVFKPVYKFQILVLTIGQNLIFLVTSFLVQPVFNH